MDITLNTEVIQKYPTILFGFAILKSDGYKSENEKNKAEERIISQVTGTFSDVNEIESNYSNDLYKSFYKNMGLKPKKVSTPIKQAKRIIKNKSYRSIHKIIDICMEVEYTHLVSFQVYDVNKINGSLEYKLSKGIEVIKNFHNDEKICKKDELILADEESPIHSVYYGNNINKSLDSKTNLALIRIMGVPGILKEDFDLAIKDFNILTNNNKVYILSKDNLSINVK